jgi:hypothetical protein
MVVDEDGEYFCRVVLASDSIRFVPGPGVFYRVSGSGSYTQRTLFNMEERWPSVRLQFAHLRSLGDDERVRSACLNYLQTWLLYFYPESPEIVRQARELAATLGGRLATPRLRWKYAWLQHLCGYEKARRAQFLLPQFKEQVLRRWDKVWYDLENRRPRSEETGESVPSEK